MHFTTDPGLPDWALNPVRAGVSWWTADGGSYFQDAWDGAGFHGEFNTCGGGSYVGFDDVRLKYGDDVRGVTTYCSYGTTITELHSLLEAQVDYDIAQVAAHEWGHGLGLDHSADPNAVMYAYTNGVGALAADDVAGLRALYPGSFAFDIRPVPAPSGRLTFGASRVMDVRVRVVGGAACNPAQMRLLVDSNPLLKVTTAPLAPTGELPLRADPTDSHVCTASPFVQLKAPTGGETSLTLRPKGSVAGAARVVPIPLNRAPDAAFDVDPAAPVAGSAVTLISRSSDPDGDPATESWDLNGDGTFGDAYGPLAFTTLPAGQQTVGLRVSDGWSTSTTKQTVLVAQPPPTPITTTPTTTTPITTTPTTTTPTTPTTTTKTTPNKNPTSSGGTRPGNEGESEGTSGGSHVLRITGPRSLRGLTPRVSFTGPDGEYAVVSLRISKAVARRLHVPSGRTARATVWVPPNTTGQTRVRLRLRTALQRALRSGLTIPATLAVAMPGHRTTTRSVTLHV